MTDLDPNRPDTWPPDAIERTMQQIHEDDDPLRPARGIFLALVISGGMWIVGVALWWWLA